MHRSHICILVLFLILTESGLYAQSPYQLLWPEDGILIGSGLPLLFYSYRADQDVEPLMREALKNTDRGQVNSFDRIATYHYSEKTADLSDALLYTCLASPFILLFSGEVRRDAGTVYTMYGEALIFGISLPLSAKGNIERYRPYVYNPDVSEYIKLSADARKSFFSGHTSLAFTSMFFFASVYSHYHPGSSSNSYIWGGSILLASSVGVLRILAGKHYPSDVLVGAAIGIAAGYLIPKLHETSPEAAQIAPQPGTANAPMLALSISF